MRCYSRVKNKKSGQYNPSAYPGATACTAYAALPQRLTIARALVKNPDILILDDSASALDFATDAALRKALAGIAGEKTIFIVSQRTSSIQHADKIIVLDDGEAVGIGTHMELLKTCEVYREIYESQFIKEKGGYING